jgi:SAM-dependent methyltransferase
MKPLNWLRSFLELRQVPRPDGSGPHGRPAADSPIPGSSESSATRMRAADLPSIADELARNQANFPFPKWSLDSVSPRKWILAGVPGGGVGAEIGVFRGHFSEVILSVLAPRKFFMVDPWTKFGEFFPWSDQYTVFGKLPTALARREAQLRAARFPNTQTVILEEKFTDCIPQIDEPLDWIYIDSSHKYLDTLNELKAASSILKPDGVIIGDDYYADRTAYHHGVFRAVNEFVKTMPYEFIACGPNAQWKLRRSNVGAVAPKGQKSIDDVLAANQLRFPVPQRAFADIESRRSVLAYAPTRSVGVEVGAFRGHLSEVMLSQLLPRKFFMQDVWTLGGEFSPIANEYSHKGKLPTKFARQEAEYRAAKFPNTSTVVVEKEFGEFVREFDEEAVDWIYLHCAYDYKTALVNLAMAASIVKPGGVIMGDGYYPDSPVFQHCAFRAISEFVSAAPFELVSLGHAGQWCLRRSSHGLASTQ